MIDTETITYKQTGLDWMPEVPEHWEVLRIKNIATINDDAISEKTVTDFLIRYIDIGNVNSDGEINEIQEFKFSEAPSRARRILRKGDVIISTVRTYLKAITQISFEVDNHIASTGFAILRPRDKITTDFLSFAVRAKYFIDSIMANSFGVSYPAINSSALASLPILVPPKDEQDEIVQYIKAQEEKINLFIQKKQRFIELLKEQRLSIVFKTVTKGINKDVPFKETNIDWIGKVPSHWELKRMKYLCKISNGMDCEKEDVGEFPVYGSGGIFGWTNKSLYDMPSVLLGRKGTIDKPIFVTEPFWTVDTAFYTRIFEEVVEPSFFYQICCCIPFESLSTKTALPSMTQTALYQVKMPIPPIEEQRQIVAHIKTETATIDTTIAKAEREIELIKEYKEAMISEAVMGKRKMN